VTGPNLAQVTRPHLEVYDGARARVGHRLVLLSTTQFTSAEQSPARKVGFSPIVECNEPTKVTRFSSALISRA